MNNKTQKTDYTLTKDDCKRLLREYPELKAAYEQFVKIDFVGDAVMAEHEDYEIQLSDDTVIGEEKWETLKYNAMQYRYQEQPWFQDLKEETKLILQALRQAQANQEDMEALVQ